MVLDVVEHVRARGTRASAKRARILDKRSAQVGCDTSRVLAMPTRATGGPDITAKPLVINSLAAMLYVDTVQLGQQGYANTHDASVRPF